MTLAAMALWGTASNAGTPQQVANRALLGTVSFWGGQVCLATGIPVHIVGKNRRNGAIRDYCLQHYSAMPTPHFQFNLYPQSVGLAYVF